MFGEIKRFESKRLYYYADIFTQGRCVALELPWLASLQALVRQESLPVRELLPFNGFLLKTSSSMNGCRAGLANLDLEWRFLDTHRLTHRKNRYVVKSNEIPRYNAAKNQVLAERVSELW